MNDDAAEAAALARATAEGEADLREVPHAEVRAWLLQVAAGDFDAEPPAARILSAADKASEGLRLRTRCIVVPASPS